MLEQQLAMTEERVWRLEGEKLAAETRAEQAERSVSMHSLVVFLFTLTFIPELIMQSFIILYTLLNYSGQLFLRVKILIH